MLDYRQKHSAWSGAQERLFDCHSLLDRIHRLRMIPKFAVLNADSPQAISQRVTDMANATLPAEALVRIESEPGRRLGNTSYVVQPTRIVLEDVTLVQLASFASALESTEEGLVISEMSLKPSDGTDEERWSTELKLTQTVYSASFPIGK